MTNTTHTITVNGLNGNREEVVKPLREKGHMTLVARLNGSRVSTKWVRTDRIQSREQSA